MCTMGAVAGFQRKWFAVCELHLETLTVRIDRHSWWNRLYSLPTPSFVLLELLSPARTHDIRPVRILISLSQAEYDW